MLSKVDDFGEAARYEQRFAKIPTGYAFRANDGDVRPLTKDEANAALAEGLAAIRHGAQALHFSTWVILAIAVAGVMVQNGGGHGIFSSGAIVGIWAPVLHLLGWAYFQWQARRVPSELSMRIRNRISLSPALVGPMMRRNWLKPIRGAMAIGIVGYVLWIVYTITGSPDPHSLGAGAMVVHGDTGAVEVIGGGDPAGEMSAFSAHLPELLVLIAICYAIYFAELLVDMAIRKEVERIGRPQ